MLPRQGEHGFHGGHGDAFSEWHHGNIGNLLLPPPGTDPLHYLMCTGQQVTDHFGSSGPADGDGNDVAGGNPLPVVITFLDSVNLAGLGAPTTAAGPWRQSNLGSIRDRMIPLLIHATAGLLHWFSRETQLITGARPGQAPTPPPAIELPANYPNPFNPVTTLNYALPAESRVLLTVFPILGREVATLMDEVQAAGVRSAASNAAGVQSGVYICRLQAGAYVKPGKVLLLR